MEYENSNDDVNNIDTIDVDDASYNEYNAVTSKSSTNFHPSSSLIGMSNLNIYFQLKFAIHQKRIAIESK